MKVKELVSCLLLPFWFMLLFPILLLLNLAEWKRERERMRKRREK